jgi:hypothetical protein
LANRRINFWHVTLCSELEVRRHFGRTYCLHRQDRKVRRASNKQELSSEHTLSTLKIEVVRSSEISLNLYPTTRRKIPEDSTLHSHHCENLKSRNSGNEINISRNIFSLNRGKRIGSVEVSCVMFYKYPIQEPENISKVINNLQATPEVELNCTWELQYNTNDYTMEPTRSASTDYVFIIISNVLYTMIVTQRSYVCQQTTELKNPNAIRPGPDATAWVWLLEVTLGAPLRLFRPGPLSKWLLCYQLLRRRGRLWEKGRQSFRLTINHLVQILRNVFPTECEGRWWKINISCLAGWHCSKGKVIPVTGREDP